jgi:hypothetical protein
MPVTYEILATTTITGSPSDVTFSSIPQGYTDLRLVASVQVGSISAIGVRLNNDTGTSYGFEDLYISSSNNIIAARTIQTRFDVNFNSNQRTNNASIITMDIFQYASSTMQKSVLYDYGMLNGTTGANENQRVMNCGLYYSTTNITSLTLQNASGNPFTNGGTMTLFGILRA